MLEGFMIFPKSYKMNATTSSSLSLGYLLSCHSYHADSYGCLAQ